MLQYERCYHGYYNTDGHCVDMCGEEVYSITTNEFVPNEEYSQIVLYDPLCISACPGIIPVITYNF